MLNFLGHFPHTKHHGISSSVSHKIYFQFPRPLPFGGPMLNLGDDVVLAILVQQSVVYIIQVQ